MPYCMYLRKSRADKELEARGEGETLSRHERALQMLATRLGLPVAAVYREIVSGETISSRPVMQTLLSEVEQGAWDGVFVMEVERLARGDTIDQGIVAQAFRCTNTRILTPAKIYDPSNESDEEYFEFGLFMSRREYKTINRRLQRGRAASASEGRYPGSLPPYGYRRVRLDGQKGFTLVPDPEQAAAVNLIFSLYVHGETQPGGGMFPLGAGRIAEELNRLQIPTVKGGGWSAATVYSILHNPVYVGKIRWRARPLVKKSVGGRLQKTRPRAAPQDTLLADGLHPPIVEPSLWQAAQQKAPHKTSASTGAKPLQNPLSGLVVCSQCGRRMVRRPLAGGDVLICRTKGCPTISCSMALVRRALQAALETLFGGFLVRFSPAQTNAGSPQAALRQQTETALQNALESCRRQAGRLCDLLEQGVYTPERFQERQALLEQRMQSLAQQLSSLPSGETAAPAGLWQPLPPAQPLPSLYADLQSAADQNALLKTLFESITYTKLPKNGVKPPADGFTLTVYPKWH